MRKHHILLILLAKKFHVLHIKISLQASIDNLGQLSRGKSCKKEILCKNVFYLWQFGSYE